eukprot:CAMPEP_0170559574 /NCGR_PEP_ID=MMETSP0211-20121228/43673_1 /TAXON_ID=311385 /ORGANISM="Pseudokeronopsis sp., Strain OXSARD2" /LENGTH=219 /DNA_ID=CAMNT_0010872755 /DNA_START=66 /DNA_END=725 /DNA_ORIENTATION=+
MADEEIKNEIGVMRKDFENRVNTMQAIVDGKDGEMDALKQEIQKTIDDLKETIKTKDQNYDELNAKYTELNDMITKNKEFKRGQSEYDKMLGRIAKLEQEADLYKKVVQRMEREQKKEKLAMQREYEIISTENVKLLAEVRTLKEDREAREEEVTGILDELNGNFAAARREKEEIKEHFDFMNNELKLVKDVNAVFRQENNKIQSQYVDSAKKLEQFQL